MKFICPLIVVDDIQKSRHLYENILGQTVIKDYGENVIFAGDFANKNLIEVGERLEHVAFRLFRDNFSMDETCQITHLTREAVENAIKEYS